MLQTNPQATEEYPWPTVKICDFSFSRRISSEDEEMKTIVGTPFYMSPEIHSGKGYSYRGPTGKRTHYLRQGADERIYKR